MVKKLLDLIFRIVSFITLFILKLLSQIKSTKKSSLKKLAALPYYPQYWPGGHERIANWKPYFENENISYDIFWGSTNEELLNYFESSNDYKRYYIFYLCLFRRAKIFLKLLNYDAVWIQRAFIPYFPFKDAYFEKALFKIHPNVIMDYYDADYLSNYNLTYNSVKHASKVSVSTSFLKSKFIDVNKNTFLLNMTIDEKNYLVKKRYDQQHIRIGWMGNPGNIEYLDKIKNELKQISLQYHHVSFHFLCRKLPKFDIDNLYNYNWDNTQFNYYQWLSSIDIGIIPYIGDNDRLKAKSAMKTLEFMACGIPLITTEHGNFENMIHNEHYLLANKNEDWLTHLKLLIENPVKREEIGKNGYDFFIQNNTYKNNYLKLKKIFFE